jgi:3-oxoacyl-(acyl-carrier-protein) synthase
MNPKISSYGMIHGKTDHDLIESYLAKPEFRKATPSMTMAYAALKKALNLLPRTIDQQNMGVVVGSSYGELELTEQFLVHLKKNNMARPMIFQNSLHQSILGFLSMMLRSSGPALTVSNRFFSGENALEAGQTLLGAGACETCAVIAVDAFAPTFAPVYERLYPQGLTVGQGACAMILSDKGAYKVQVSCGLPPEKN